MEVDVKVGSQLELDLDSSHDDDASSGGCERFGARNCRGCVKPSLSVVVDQKGGRLLAWCLVVDSLYQCGTIETTLEVSLQLTDSERMVDVKTSDANLVSSRFTLRFCERARASLKCAGGRRRDGGRRTLGTRVLRSLKNAAGSRQSLAVVSLLARKR
jgi:hypothetical protein|tara:strand:- start:53 stop:526 length:474 start_codon:yes stop_codon:yes gene_type:complete